MAKPSRKAPPRALSLLASIVESSDDAIIGQDLDGTITSWNDGARRLYGWTAAEAVGRRVSFLAPESRRSEIPHILARVRAGKSVKSLETLRVAKDGRTVEVSLTVSPIRGAAGRVVGAAAIARDITERRRSEERFRAVVEGTPNALVMTDGAGRIALVNAQAEKLFGWTRAEMIGRPIETLLPPRARVQHQAHREGFAAAPAARAMGAGRDLFGLRKDGTEVPLEIGLSPLKQGDETYVLASIIDITERRALERKLAHSETLATLGGMAAVMSHEIRNPLSSIVMAAGALARGGLEGEDLAQVMSILTGESRRLQRVLEDFLQYSRPREPRLELCDLNKTVREILAAAKSDPRLVGETQVKASLDPALREFAFDQDQIRQVLWNVIRNAFQALGGSGRVEVRTEARPGAAAVVVADTGPGIAREDLERIFTPFFTTKTKGTGLGLPISRNIARAHGGDIAAESASGRGCRFTLTLPLRARAAAPASAS